MGIFDWEKKNELAGKDKAIEQANDACTKPKATS